MDINSNLNLILFLIFFISTCSTILLVPLIRFIGKKYKLIDYDDKRKLQKPPLVRVGGIAIFIGYSLGLSVIPFSGNLSNVSFNGISSLGSTLLVTSALIFLLGLIDDLVQLSPVFRLVFQFIVASISWSQGIGISQIDFSFIKDQSFIVELPPLVSFIVTIFWITALVNAFNWIDGLDGLASGLVIIASISFFLFEYSNNVISISCILISLLGTSIAFMFYNYNPAKILMGDGGSYFYGYNLSIIGFLSSADSHSHLKLYVPFLLLFVPIADMVYVILRRCFTGKTPFFPDNTHIHHRLLSIGYTERQTVRLIFSISLILSSIVLSLENIINPIFIVYSLLWHCLINVKIRNFFKRIFC